MIANQKHPAITAPSLQLDRRRLPYLHMSTMSLGKRPHCTALRRIYQANTDFTDEGALEAVANGGSIDLYVSDWDWRDCAGARDTDALI